MKELLSAGLALVAMAMAPPLSAEAQSIPASGLYQIVSGEFIMCCGAHSVPYGDQAFIRLNVDSNANSAQMTILGEDMTTILRLSGPPPPPPFFYSLTNGIVTPGRISFGDTYWPPQPTEIWSSFTVSNSPGALLLNGTVIIHFPGQMDPAVAFTHTNVVALLMPTATIRVSEVSVCWDAVSNRTYQIQYRSALTTNLWLDLGAPLTATGAVQCVADALPPGEPRRFYRVLSLP
jgi:hypothetical protein